MENTDPTKKRPDETTAAFIQRQAVDHLAQVSNRPRHSIEQDVAMATSTEVLGALMRALLHHWDTEERARIERVNTPTPLEKAKGPDEEDDDEKDPAHRPHFKNSVRAHPGRRPVSAR